MIKTLSFPLAITLSRMLTAYFYLSLFVFVLVLSLLNSVRAQATYKSMSGKDCVANTYKEVLFAAVALQCSAYCTVNDQCQGYKMSDQECHLFVYTKTSHRVNKDKICAASNEIIWVKEDSYKECPNGFGYEFYGIKYKLVNIVKSQTDAIAHCESLGVNSRLADALDFEELSHLANISISAGVTGGVWLDGAQVSGATEPAGGWKWTAAGVDVDPSMWMSGQPNNSGGNEHSAYLYVPVKKLGDKQASNTYPSICECNAVLN